MITKVEINNFMAIQSQTLDLKKVSVICGMNNSCKTTALVAIGWILTGKIINFDNPGVGESDLNPIVPVNMQEGEVVSVTITVENNGAVTTYTRELKPVFNENGKITTNTQILKMNGAKQASLKNWNTYLYKDFNFEPAIPMLANEILLYINPVYALMLMHPLKELRLVLKALGANVETEEIYNKGFEDLRSIGQIHKNNFVEARTAYKKEINDIKKNIDVHEGIIANLKDVPDEFDSSNLNELQAKKEALLIQKINISTTPSNQLIKELEAKKDNLILQKKHIRETYRMQIEQQISSAKMHLSIEQGTVDSKKALGKKKYEDALIQTKLKIDVAERSIRVYEKARQYLLDDFAEANKKLIQTTQNESDAMTKVEALKKQSFPGEATCPNCNYRFATDPVAYKTWLAATHAEITKYNKIIVDAPSAKEKLAHEKADIKVRGQNIRTELDKALNELDELKATQAKLEADIKNVDNEPSDLSGVVEAQAAIADLESKLYDDPAEATKLQHEIEAVDLKIKSALGDAAVLQEHEMQELLENINLVSTAIEQELNIKSQVELKAKALLDRKAAQVMLNNKEHTLARINDFIHTMIKDINDKAYKLTGIRFVMLEENQKDDKLQEVCYAVDENGVPYERINSSRKIEMGCKFIARVKQILADKGLLKNTLPVITDGLEKVDFIEKLAQYTEDQLICTRVTTDPQVVVR